MSVAAETSYFFGEALNSDDDDSEEDDFDCGGESSGIKNDLDDDLLLDLSVFDPDQMGFSML